MSLLSMVAMAQVRSISGTVIDDLGEPVIGANVLEVGTSNGSITDIDGNFTLKVQPNAKLQVSFIGYTTKTVPVGTQSVLKITLSDDQRPSKKWSSSVMVRWLRRT
jgi:hypothetical protein